MIIITRVHKFYQSSAERRREDRASSREAGAAFLLVMFCCDRHSGTKCLKQIKHFAIGQLIRFLVIYTVIMKHVSTFTHEARAALFGASTGREMTHDQKSTNTQRHEEDSDIHTSDVS